jgi:ribosomal-protein-alanine N-acetyltransferase
MIELLTDKTVAQTYMLPDFPDQKAAVALFERLRQLSHAEDRFVYGIFTEDTLVGFLNDVEILEDSVELGYAILPRQQNNGYATQALAAAIEVLFQLGYAAVHTGAFEENIPSIRVMEKCGMTRLEKVEDIDYRGKTHRCIFFEKRP